MHMLTHGHHYTAYLHSLKGKLVASLTIRDFVANMSSFFIPVFLYSFGYSPLFIASYYVAYFGLGFFVYKFSAWVIIRYGIYHSLFASYISLTTAIALLSFAGTSIGFVYAAFVPLLLSEKLFWPARHIDISRLFSSGKTMKQTTSVINSLNMFVAAIAPLFGGLIAAQYGPAASLFAAFLIMLFAIGLLKNEYIKEKGEPIRSTFDKKYTRPMIGNAAMNAQSITSALLWPLFIYLALDSFSSIGLIFSITFAVSLIITYASGNWFESIPYFRGGMIFRIVSFPLRAFASSFGGLFFADLTGAIGNGMMNSRYMSRYYNGAKHSGDIDSFVLSFERGGELGKLFIWVILWVLLLFGVSVQSAIAACFFVAACTMPLTALVGAKKEE